jgi:uncharacterized membrane protein
VAENDSNITKATDAVKEPVKEATKEATQTVTSEMKKVARDAAIVVLTPVVKKAATNLTKQLATKGPELYQDYLEPKIEEAGGIGNLAKQATGSGGLKGMAVGKAAEGLVDKVTGGKGGGKADGTGRGRRLPVQESIDVGVPIDVAYNEWTQFENFPEFMHRVERIEQIDDTHLVWHENIWGRRRSWKAVITDQTPNERVAWRSEDGVENVGVVTFHDLGDRLTRILVNLDFQPKGLVEKTASGFRISRRALRSDLMRFKAHIEMQDEEEGAWRGTVEDGEVVDYDEDYENPRGESDDYEDEDEDEPEGQSGEYDEDEADEEPDEQSDEYDEEDEEEPDEQSDEYEEDEDEPDEQSDEYDEEDEDEADEEPDEQSDEYEEDEDEEEPEEAPPARRASRRGSSSARKAASGSARKATSGARKAASGARKSAPTRKAASGTRKKATPTARKAASSGSRKKATAPARKAASSSTRKASSSTRKAASSSTRKKAAAPARKTASTARKKSAAPARKAASGARKKAASTSRGARRTSR